MYLCICKVHNKQVEDMEVSYKDSLSKQSYLKINKYIKKKTEL